MALIVVLGRYISKQCPGLLARLEWEGHHIVRRSSGQPRRNVVVSQAGLISPLSILVSTLVAQGI